MEGIKTTRVSGSWTGGHAFHRPCTGAASARSLSQAHPEAAKDSCAQAGVAWAPQTLLSRPAGISSEAASGILG